MEFTIKDTKNGLCGTCGNSHTVRMKSGSEWNWCKAFDPAMAIHGEVTECGRYSKVNEPALYEMKQMAWYIDTEGGKVIGFVKPGSEKHKLIRKSDFNE